MSSNDFERNVKELDLIIKHNEKEHLLTCTILEFLDKILINVSMDGETDISYDIQIPEMNDLKKPIRRYEDDDNDDNEEDSKLTNSTIIPTVLIGAGNNIKIQVLASQIGHEMSQLSTKNIILNISGKIFCRSSLDQHRPEDSLIVQQCIHLVRETYLSQ